MNRHYIIRFSAAAAVFVFLFAACGGGGGGGGSSADISNPSGITIYPENSATEVDLSLSVTATFPVEIDESTISGSTFLLTGPNGAVEGEVSYDPSTRTATFTPKARFASLANYTAMLSTAIQSKGGGLLASDYSWKFTTRNRKWGIPQLIETNDETYAMPAGVSINEKGDAIAIWTPINDGLANLWANTYTISGGWGTPQPIVNDGNVSFPYIGIDNNSNGISIWTVSNGTRLALYSSRYTRTEGWGPAQIIDRGYGAVEYSSFAMSVSGYAVAAWDQGRDVYINIYTPGQGWGTAQVLNEMDNYAHNSSVAMDSAGNATVVWEQFDDVGDSIWAKHYTVGEGWDSALIIDNSTDTRPPTISMSENGNAVAVWEQYDSGCKVAANRYVPGEGWKTPQIISYYCSYTQNYESAVDNNGNIVTIWINTDGSVFQTWFNSFKSGGDWGAAGPIESSETSPRPMPQIGANSFGNFISVRAICDYTSCPVLAANLTSEGDWGASEMIQPGGSSGDIYGLSMNSSGDAVAIMAIIGETHFDVWAVFYQ